MFHLLYVRRELRRRLGRTVLTALGLAMGVGLVIGIIGVSQGLDEAQHQVLAPLDSVGTDILVTRVVGSTATASATTTPTTVAAPSGGFAFGPPGGGGGGGFFRGGGPNAGLNQDDANQLLSENKNVITDLAALGKPGEKFTRDFFLSATLLSFPAEAVNEVAKIDGVTSAVGGLVQLAQHQTGTVPEIVSSIQTGGETVTQTVRPDPMTDAEQEAFRTCVEANGGFATFGGGPGGGAGTTPTTTAGQVNGQQAPAGGGGGGGRGRFDSCLPQRFREFRASFTSPLRTIEQVVNPPQTDIANESYTAAGIDPDHSTTGLVTSEQLTDGAWLSKDATTDVLVNVAHATKKSLQVGSTLAINGTDYKVVGLVSPTLTGSTADVYFPLATLQKLATKQDRVTQVSVTVDKAGDVARVKKSIEKLLPGAEVVTAASLADQVSGSLADAHDLAGRFGGILAVIVLLAAVAIAALLTLASVAKRVREIGTLRAIGWSRGRVVRQIVGETTGIGLLGGVLGIGVGAVVVALVGLIAPSLSATTSGVPGLTNSSAARFFGQAQTVASSSTVQLHAVMRPSTMLLGLVFALGGGLVAGAIGSWRAARLAPAVALRDLG